MALSRKPKKHHGEIYGWLESEDIYQKVGACNMNKHHGSKFDEYLKEKGKFEEISALAQKRWEELQTDEPSDTSEIIEESPSPIARFFRWLRHAMNL